MLENSFKTIKHLLLLNSLNKFIGSKLKELSELFSKIKSFSSKFLLLIFIFL